MKPLYVLILATILIGFASCSKDEDAAVPTACFTVSALDSAKVSTLSQFTIDSLIKVNAPGYFISFPENTSARAYRKTLIFRYCGTSTNYKAIYTGDATHVYVEPSNPGSITTLQSGVNFPGDYIVYTYTSGGTYPVSVVSSNVSSTGKDLKKSVATKTVILQ